MQLRPYDPQGNFSNPGSISGPQSGGSISRLNRPIRGMIRILLADDHAVMRQGLAASLSQEPDIVIVGEAVDGKMAVERAKSLQPDVILMDISMPHLGGIEATREIHLQLPNVRVIALSMFEEDDFAHAMLEAGAVAYLSKSCSMEALTSTIRRCVL